MRSLVFAAGAQPAVGRLDEPDGPGRRAPASTPSGIDRRPGRAARSRGAPAARRTASPATCGADEDAGPTYTSEPLLETLEILGVPEVVVHLEVDAPVATLSVRLLGRGARRVGRRW